MIEGAFMKARHVRGQLGAANSIQRESTGYWGQLWRLLVLLKILAGWNCVNTNPLDCSAG